MPMSASTPLAAPALSVASSLPPEVLSPTSLGLSELALEATGSAQVLVIMNPTTLPTVGDVAARLGGHFRTSETSQATALALDAGHPAPTQPYRIYPRLGVMLGTVNPAGLHALRQEENNGTIATLLPAPLMRLIKPERCARAVAPRTKTTWGIRKMGVPRLWAQGLTGAGVTVAHLDTGVDNRHPALDGAVAHYAEFDQFGSRITPNPAPWDSGDHGTHTAATIAARPVRGKHVGVAPGAHLASAMVIEGGLVQARVLGGLEWALGQNARVLSISLGFSGYVPSFLSILQVLRANGVLPVVAVGNDYAGISRSPGNHAEALSVGALDPSGAVAGFSSSQSFPRPNDPLVPDVLGPGVKVLSARPGGGYQEMDGTSMATPHIAGLAALLFEAKPTATVDEVERAIFESCGPVPSAGRSARGLPNAARALQLLST